MRWGLETAARAHDLLALVRLVIRRREVHLLRQCDTEAPLLLSLLAHTSFRY
jgi:hypothetical protein